MNFLSRKSAFFLFFFISLLVFNVFISGFDAPRRFLLTINHKPLFPLETEDVIGTILVCLGLLIAASGGIGGGGILVPLFILIFGFGPKHAVALSNFCILATSITNMVLNLPKRHPHANRPLVDWDLILVMEPLTMGGAVSINFVFPTVSVILFGQQIDFGSFSK